MRLDPTWIDTFSARRRERELADRALVDQFYRELEGALKPKPREPFADMVERLYGSASFFSPARFGSIEPITTPSFDSPAPYADWHHAAAAAAELTVPGDELLRDATGPGEIGN